PKSKPLRSRSNAGDVDMALPSRELVLHFEAAGADRVVDLLPALRAHADPALWSATDEHLTPAAHALWFEVMRAPLRELLQRPPRSRAASRADHAMRRQAREPARVCTGSGP